MATSALAALYAYVNAVVEALFVMDHRLRAAVSVAGVPSRRAHTIMEELITSALSPAALDAHTPPCAPLELPALRAALLDGLTHPALRLPPPSADALFSLAAMGLKAQALGSPAAADVANHSDQKLRVLREVVTAHRTCGGGGSACGADPPTGGRGGLPAVDEHRPASPSRLPPGGRQASGEGAPASASCCLDGGAAGGGRNGGSTSGGGDGDDGDGGSGGGSGGGLALASTARQSRGAPPPGGTTPSATAALAAIAAARERMGSVYEQPPPGELRRLRATVLNTLRAVAVPVGPLIADGLQASAGWLLVSPAGGRGAHLGAAAVFGRDGETVTDAYVLPIAGKGGGRTWPAGEGGGGGVQSGTASAASPGAGAGAGTYSGGDGGGGYRPDNLYSEARHRLRRERAVGGGWGGCGGGVGGGEGVGVTVARPPSPPGGGGGGDLRGRQGTEPLHEGEALLPTGRDADNWGT
ncbi:hypothetical protein MMPV_000464 [Pyropia vietnamensis]